MSRIQAREKVFTLVYEYLFNSEKSEITLNDYLQDAKLSDDDISYIQNVYNGVIDKYSELCEYVYRYAEGFKPERIFKIDMSILLLAIYELLYVKDIPFSVTCNEAVNLAKTYSTEKSPSFINGILANIIKKEELTK